MEIERVPLTEININHFIEECGINKEEAKEIISNYRNNYYKYQHKILGYNKFNEAFSDNLTIYGNKDYYITNIKFSKKELLTKICKLLNIKESKNITESLNKKIEELKQIKTEEELKSFSPLIYEDYINGQKLYREFTSINDFAVYLTEDERTKEFAKATKKEKYYYSCGLRNILSHFIEIQSKIYTNIIKHLEDINTTIDRVSMNTIINYLDKDKAKFYLANKYLEEYFICKDKEKKNIYMSLITKFIAENNHKDLIIHNQFGEEISYNSFIKIYRNITDTNKLLTNWELLPSGKKHNSNTGIIRNINNTENLDKYINLNNKKLKLYEESPYIGKAKGLCLNKGYTAFFYKNGKILLDKISDSIDNIKSSYGNAIYELDTDNFSELSMLDKEVLRNEKLCPTYNHSGFWEDRIKDIINLPSDEITINKTNELIRKLKATH